MLSNLGACFPPEGIGAQGPYRAFKNVTFFYNVLKIPAGIAIAIRYEVELFLFLRQDSFSVFWQIYSPEKQVIIRYIYKNKQS